MRKILKNTTTKIALSAILVTFLIPSGAKAIDITVNPENRYQTIEGFGASSVYYNNWLFGHDAAIQKEVCDTAFVGLGLSLLRVGNWHQDLVGAGDDPEATNYRKYRIADDPKFIAEGRKRLGDSFKLFMVSYTAPATLKASNLTHGSGISSNNNTLKKEAGQYVYDQFAHWWKISLDEYAKIGISPDYISIQNEPDWHADYESMVLGKTEGSIAGYPQALKAVADTLATMDNPPLIYGPEPIGIQGTNFQDYADALDKNDLAGYCYHLYSGNNNQKYNAPDGYNAAFTAIANQYSDKPIIMSEFSPRDDDADVQNSDMMNLARIIRNNLIYGNASGYMTWSLIWKQNGQMVALEDPWNKASWVNAKGYKINPEYHGMRHYSKFVRPGWSRIEANSGSPNLQAVAFASPENDTISLVLLNISSAANANIAPENYRPYSVCQSQTGGPYSQELAFTEEQTDWTIPQNTITTMVFIRSIPNGVVVPQMNQEIPAFYKVYSITGQLQGCYSYNNFSLAQGIWLVESLRADGSRISFFKYRFSNPLHD